MISLYVKSHNITDKMYFGKTIRDSFKYKGSGSYWTNHLKKHGNKLSDISNLLMAEFEENDPMLIEYALGFSAANDIVNSKDWANQVPETGHGGTWVKGMVHSPETLKKMSDNRADVSGENNPRWGVTLDIETKDQISDSLKEWYKNNTNPLKDSKRTDKSKRKSSRSRREGIKNGTIIPPMQGKKGEDCPNYGRFEINNGTRTIRVTPKQAIWYLSDGWETGAYKRTCPYCDLVGGGSTMFKNHFDNCKHRWDSWTKADYINKIIFSAPIWEGV